MKPNVAPKAFLKKGEGHAAWSSQLKELKKQKSITLSSEIKNNPKKTGNNEQVQDKGDLFSIDDSKDLMEFEKIEKLSESLERLSQMNTNNLNNDEAKTDHNPNKNFLLEKNYFNEDFPYDIPFNGSSKEKINLDQVQHHFKQSPTQDHVEENDEVSSKLVTAKFVPGIKPVHCINRPQPVSPKCSPKESSESNDDLPNIYLPEALSNGQVMIMTDKLKLWITKLESEIKAFNKKIKEADESKVRYENLCTKLKNENSKEEAFFLKAKKEFEDYRENELKRLKRERKVLDEYQSTLKNLSAKKDKSEIENLINQLNVEREENEVKVNRLTGQLNQSRTRISDLEQERTNLRVRITRMEQEILDLQSKLRLSENDRTIRSNYQGSTLNNNETIPDIQSVNQMLYDQLTKLGNITSSLTNKSSPTEREPNVSEASSVLNKLSNNQIDLAYQKSLDNETICNEVFSQRSDEMAKEISKFDQRYPKGTIIDEKINKDGSIETRYSNGLVTIKFNNGSVKEIYPDGKTNVVYFFNGDIKTTYPDGKVIYTYAIDQTMHITFPDEKPDEIHYADGRCEILSSRSKQPDSARSKNSAEERYSEKHEQSRPPAMLNTKAYMSNSTNCLANQKSLESQEYITPCILRQKTMASAKSTMIQPTNNNSSHIHDHLPKQQLPSSTVMAKDNFVEIIKSDYLTNYCAKMNLPPGTRGRHDENGNVEIHYPNGQIEVHSCNFKRRIYPDGNTKTIFYDGRQETIYASGRIRVKDALGNLVFDSRTSGHHSMASKLLHQEQQHFSQGPSSSSSAFCRNSGTVAPVK